MRSGAGGYGTATLPGTSARLPAAEPRPAKARPAKLRQWQTADAECTAAARPVRRSETRTP